MIRRLIILVVCFAFFMTYYQPVVLAKDFNITQLPMPGNMVGVSSAFVPLALKGLVVNLQKPLEFQFIVDTGRGSEDLGVIKEESKRLLKYFLTGLTIPEGDLWVNLSPYEKDSITTNALGQTELGRDLLAQDYVLKQLTASLIYPEKDLGKIFWAKVYKQAQEQYGTTEIPVNTFNKVWILPNNAQVFENKNAAYVTQATMKVMLDEDYTALNKNKSAVIQSLANNSHSVASKIIREIVLPEIEKEINFGKNFAPLRQMYQALILAKWYKETISNGLLDAVYNNKGKLAGINLEDPTIKQEIYDRYLKAYKKGVFNYIKEESLAKGVVARKYFSGGLRPSPVVLNRRGKPTMVQVEGKVARLDVNLAMMSEMPSKNDSINDNIAELVQRLNAIDVQPKIRGMNLLAFNHNLKEMISFIQENSVLKKEEDIRRVLMWRLQAKNGVPLSGVESKKAIDLYNSIFDQEELLNTMKKPLNIVLFRRGRSQQLTNILKTKRNLNIKIVLSGTDDGLSWFYGAREFNATGISGAGRALIDLARDVEVAKFLSFRIQGLGKDDEALEANFRAMLMKLEDKRFRVEMSDEMRKLYQLAMKMGVEKRIAMVAFLRNFLNELDGKRTEGLFVRFTFRDVPIRSLVLVGAVKEGNWQEAINQVATILNVDPRHEVILPTEERQHLVAIRSDGTIYFSETGLNLYDPKAPILGMWLIDLKTYNDLIKQKSFQVNSQDVFIEQLSPEVVSSLSVNERKEVLETTRKTSPERAVEVAEYLSSVSSTGTFAKSKISITSQASEVLRSADVILYSNEFLETNVGGALVVPGLAEAIESNQNAVKVNLLEVAQDQDGFINYLERVYRYLTGKMLHSNRLMNWDKVERYVDYVLGGKILKENVKWLEESAKDVELVTDQRVHAVTVSAQSNSEHGFFSSGALIESLLALKGIKESGFVVSNHKGLMPRANTGTNVQGEFLSLGIFKYNNKVQELIKEVRRNWPIIKNYGAFVFDVDKTILPPGSKGLNEYQELAYMFMRLLREDVQVAIISGNSQSEQMNRIYEAIKSEMKDDFSAFKNLTFYVNGGATKVEFSENGEANVNVKYEQDHRMNITVMRSAINHVIQQGARDKFLLTAQQQVIFEEKTRSYLLKRYPNLKYRFSWVNSETVLEPEWLTEDDLSKAIAAQREVSIPWIEKRGQSKGSNDTVASLTIKPTIEFIFEGKKMDVRLDIQRKIEEMLRIQGQSPEKYKFRPGGSTSTDITLADTEKPAALLDLIESKGLNQNWVFYFGDEFYVYDGKDGNDEVIARDGRLKGVRTLAVNEENMEGAALKTQWIGRTPQATMEFLESVLDSAMFQADLRVANNSKDLGGIDLNKINVNRSGQSVVVQFDPAQLNQIKQNGFKGFQPMVTDVQFIKSPLQLLGVSP